MLAPLALLALLIVAGVSLMGARRVLDDGAARVAGMAAVAGLGVVVLLAALAAGVGVGVGDRGATDDADEDDGPPVEETTVGEDAGGPAPLRDAAAVLLAVGPLGLPPVPAAVGDLQDGDSLVLRVHGLDPGSTATVHQCVAGTRRARSCRPGLPFTVSDDQRSTVLVDAQVRFDGGGETVDCRSVDCSVVVFGSSRLELLTFFGQPAPPPVTVDVDPATVAPGGTLTATAEHLRPGSETSFVVCRPVGDQSADCGDPTPADVVGLDGLARSLVRVGSGRCPRGAQCAVAVIVDGGGPRAYAPLRLIGRGGVTYDDTRLAVGIGAAGLLLLLALALLRRTDWTPVEGDPFAGITIPEDPFADVVDR